VPFKTNEALILILPSRLKGPSWSYSYGIWIYNKVVSSNPVHDEKYSIQVYVIKCISELRQVGGFLRVLRF
jgi:hypothetical protein